MREGLREGVNGSTERRETAGGHLACRGEGRVVNLTEPDKES